MLPAMAAKPRIAIVGPGRLGTALALELKRAGYKIAEIVSRDSVVSRRKARALARKVGAMQFAFSDAPLDGDVIWFCVPDREIAATGSKVSLSTEWRGKIAFHSSGALASDELNGLRKRGASVASVHPMMTFVSGSVPSLKGVPFAVEGDAAAVRLARKVAHELGGKSFVIQKKHKAAYHAWGGFTSPLLVSLLVTAEQVARAAGLSGADARKKMLPIIRQTMANYAKLGPASAFSGPMLRGDAETVRKHLQVLKKVPEAREVYLALAGSALRYLPVGQRKKLEAILASRSKRPAGRRG
jgi:predicted short-subunit dehydrogenase-like oxidoreductase (DUF2520 family)